VTEPRRVAVVTGGARGIGSAIGRAFADTGLAVVLADVDASELKAAAAMSRREGEVSTAVVDVRDEAALEQFYETVIELHGRLDVIVANAGIADRGAVLHGDTREWRRVVETNLLGAALTVRALAGDMVGRGAGDVVLLASLSGRMSYVGEPLYIASKWGLVGFGHALRAELAPLGIRVTLIEPGLVRTELSARDEPGRSLLASSASLDVADVAAAVVYATSQPPGVAVSELVIQPNRAGGW
jgi:NADP-dependent 3-hydroxy acid dehydrogenase YdfG